MRISIPLLAISGLAVGTLSGNASAWSYTDAINEVYISGSACRANSDANERKVTHPAGRTTVRSGYIDVLLYCPIARRNLHAYDKQLDSAVDVKIDNITIRVNSPQSTVECRLFGKDASTGSVQYSTWQGVFYSNIIWLNLGIDWNSYSWGLQCKASGGESINSIYAQVHYNQNN